MAQRTIAILGGTGFVGSYLIPRLARDGHRLKLLVRDSRRRDLPAVAGLDRVEVDVESLEGLRQSFEGCDAVINLVGILNEKGHDGKGFYRAHVALPRRVVEACRTAGVQRMLHMSALGASAAWGHSHYQRTKGEGENLVHAAHDLHATSFRPSVIFGPGDSFLSRFARLLRVSPVLPLACANARFAPVYVADVVECYARALDLPETVGQRYELCGPHTYRLQELVEYTAQVSGRRRKVVPLGDTLSRWQANLMEFLPGKPLSRDNYLSMLTPNVCEHGFPPVFGIEPTPLEQIAPEYLAHR